MSDNWMDAENTRASNLAQIGETVNNSAPRLQKAVKKLAPVRHIRSIYIQASHGRAFDQLVFNQKMLKGKKSPDLMEEAIELLMRKYDIKF